jgi:hypothetical protein
MAYFLGTCSLALALVLLGAACHHDVCTGDCCVADCPCVTNCSCNDGTMHTEGCGPTVCTDACSGHGGAVDGGDGG